MVYKIGKMLLVALGLLGLGLVAGPNEKHRVGAEPSAYVCPPCGCNEDGKAYEAPGMCDGCGMGRIGRYTYNDRVEVNRNRPSSQLQVAILVFDGVQIIDYTGPYEVFGQANYQVHLVSKTKGRIVTSMGMKVETDYGFEDCPDVDVLLIPGGGVNRTLEDEEAIAWVKAKAEATPHVISVCNGAYILAETGLLDGKSATTFYRLIDGLAHRAPKVKVVSDKRFVESGKFVITAGLSSGIDGSLYLISKMRGLPEAQRTALNLEYNWVRGTEYARANFADRLLIPQIIGRDFYPRLNAPGTTWTLEDVHGNADEWHLQWRVEGDIATQALVAALANKLEKDGAWSRQSPKSELTSKSAWQFRGDDGRQWYGGLKVRKTGEAAHEVNLNIGQREAFTSN